jgi:hypothetical protein
MDKNNDVALKSSLKEKIKTKVESTSSKKQESGSDSDEDMALFIKRFKKVMEKNGYFNKNKRRGKITRRSNKPCLECGHVGHFIADCPNPKNKRKGEKNEHGKGKKRYTGESHLGVEWDSSEESSSDDEGVATMAMEAHFTKSSLFGDIINDEDDFIPTCFMAKGAKVDSKPNPNDDDDDDDALDDNECENMIKRTW